MKAGFKKLLFENQISKNRANKIKGKEKLIKAKA